jgi:hypothetical protein
MNINLENVIVDTKELEDVKNDYLNNLKMISDELNNLRESFKLETVTKSIDTYISNNEIITNNVNKSFSNIITFINNQISTYSNTNEELLFDISSLIKTLDNIKNPFLEEGNNG